MPLYEYSCESCHEVVEVLVRNQEQQLECPDCGGEKLERLISVPAAPSVKSGKSSLPVARESCGAPRCCGGGCDI